MNYANYPVMHSEKIVVIPVCLMVGNIFDDATETRNLSFTVMNLEDPTSWNSVLHLALGLVLVNVVILSFNVT